ncbi:MAG: RNA methyltransferase [Desulfosudaceae bacterium]
MENITIVLVKPRIPENIGACCRAMKNMGLERLVLVAPENPDPERVRKTATHVAADIMERAVVTDSLAEALAPFTFIAGTTARQGKQRQMVVSPPGLAATVQALPAGNKIAVLFGPEDRGLENEALKYCHRLVQIPTAGFASLNLAQAVLVICYELFTAGIPEKPAFHPRMAAHCELEGMYAHLKAALIKIDFINRENPDYWMNNFRRFFARLGLTAKEVRLIRGICRQIDWYGEKRYADGQADVKNESS